MHFLDFFNFQRYDFLEFAESSALREVAHSDVALLRADFERAEVELFGEGVVLSDFFAMAECLEFEDLEQVVFC